MGAEFCFTNLAAKNDKEAVDEGYDLIKQAQYDYGHAGYSGSFAECDGVRVEQGESLFADAEAARRWLDDNAGKWGPMVICKVVDGSYCAGAWCSS